jgi:hypothetical protein
MMNWGNGHIIAWNGTISSSMTLRARYLPHRFFSSDSRRSSFGTPDKFSFTAPLWDMINLFNAVKHEEKQGNKLGATL